MNKKIVWSVFLGACILSFFNFDLSQHFNLTNLRTHQINLQNLYHSHPWQTVFSFVGIYVVVTALSLPGATLLSLAGGSVFGLWVGTAAVSIASTLGATGAFLIARMLLRGWVQEKFGDKLQDVNRGIEREGAFYLFALRLVPVFPFFIINLVMALTPIKTTTFFFVSQIGMLPGTLVYVNAGTQLASIDRLEDIVSPRVLLSFIALGLFPILAKKILDLRSRIS